jgi:hypothetical protein
MDDKVTKRVIFPNIETGAVILLTPAPECELTLEQIIAKDVPTNVSHQVLDVTDIPEDHTYFNAWTYEEN